MSKTIDERVVSMQFDNKNFEKNANDTLSTLDKLKNSLKFTGAAKGLEEVDKAARRTDMSVLDNGVEAVRAKFSALQIMGITALTNITNSAVNTGKRIVSALTIDPIKTGFAEYETQLNAVQTILANTESKGSTLEDVNAALDELNTYADKTIYNFTAMTRNIGTFTAAGVDLKTSVSSIKGIANLAAVSGSTSQQASIAMYQLSQALASGTVKLMDWNSVVNAGMGGQVFQDALKETARVHGVAIDDMIKSRGSFRETLQEGWLTSEILNETLEKFTMTTEGLSEAEIEANRAKLRNIGYTEKQIDEIFKLGKTANDAATKVKTFTQLMDTTKEAAQSGWTQTWEIIIGNFEEAKELWTSVSETIGNVINESAKARNDLLGGALGSGWQKFMDQGIMDEEGYKSQIKQIAKENGVAFDEMIEKEGSFEKALRAGFESGAINSDMMNTALKRLTDSYSKLSDKELANAGYTREQYNGMKKLSEELQNGSKSMQSFIDGINTLSGRELIINSFKNMFEALVKVITPIKNAFREIFPPMTVDTLYGMIKGFHNFTEKLIISESTAEKIQKTFKGLFSVISAAWSIVKKVASVVKLAIGYVVDLSGGMLNVTASIGEMLTKVSDYVSKSDLLVRAFEAIKNVIINLVEALKRFGEALKARFESSGFTGLISVIKIVWQILSTIVDKIIDYVLKLADLLGGGNGSIVDLVNSGLIATLVISLKKMFGSVGGTFEGIKDVFESFKNVIPDIKDIFGELGNTLKAFQSQIKAKALQSIAIAIAILAGSLLVLSLIDEDKLYTGIGAIGILMGLLVGFLSLFGKVDMKSKKTIKIASTMVTLASSLLILSFALAKLGKLSWGEIGRGLVAMTASFAVLTTVVYILSLIDKSGMAKNGAKQMITMAFSLVVLGGALKILATMSWNDIWRALTAMTLSLAVFTGVIALMSLINKSGMAKKGAGQMVTMAISLVILGGALKILTTMSWDDIWRSLTVMTLSLGVLVGAMALMSLISKKAGSAVTLVIVTSSLVVLAGVLKLLATMNWDDIWRALTVMSLSLVAIFGVLLLASKLSSGGLSLIATAAALVVMAGAFAALVPVLIILGNLRIETIITALVTMAVTIGIFVAAGYLLQPVIGIILALSAAMILFGIGIVAVGAGLFMMSAAFTTFIAGLAAGGVALVTFIVSLVKGIVGLIPFIVKALGETIVAILDVIISAAPKIAEAVVVLILAVLKVLTTVVPQLTEGIFEILIGVLSALAKQIPKLVDAIVDLIVGVINSLANRLPDIIQAGVNLFAKFFEGVIDALGGLDTTFLKDAIISVGLLSALMLLLGSIASLVPSAMVGILGLGVIIAELSLVLAAIGALYRIPGLNSLIQDGGALLQSIGTAIGQFFGGIIGGIASGITSGLPTMANHFSKFMTNLKPFIDGMNNVSAETATSAEHLAKALLLLTAGNLLNQISAWLTGGTDISGFGKKLGVFGEGIKEFNDQVVGVTPETVVAGAEAGKLLAEMAKTLPKDGGLWQIFSGSGDMKDFGKQLGGFGEGIAAFNAAVQHITPEKVKAAASASVDIAEMANEFSDVEDFMEIDMEVFKTKLTGLSSGVISFVTSMNSISQDDVNNISNTASSLKTAVSTLAKDVVNNMSTEFRSSTGNIASSVSVAMQSAVDTVRTFGNVLNNTVKTVMSGFVNTIKSFKEKVVDAFNSMIIVAGDTIGSETNYSIYYDAGTYLIEGFANGISDASYLAEQSAAAAATAAKEAIDEALDINSPSDETYASGYYAVAGLKNALEDGQSDITKAGKSLGSKVLYAVNLCIQKVQQMLDDGVEINPTIRPTLDLSDIEGGIGTLNSMFGNSSFMARVNSTSAHMSINQNGSGNEDIVDKLDELGDRIENTQGDRISVGNININDLDEEFTNALELIIRKVLLERRR